MSSLTPNRLKFLAQIARRSTNQALQRMPEQRRYPILVAFLYQTLIDLTDEALDLFDRCLAEAYHRPSRDLEEFRLSVARSTNEKVRPSVTPTPDVSDPSGGHGPDIRAEACREIQVPEDGTERLRERESELSGLLDRVEALLHQGRRRPYGGQRLVVSPLEAEQKPESTVELERLIDERLPLVELSELLIEVDGWTRFSDDFEHAGGTEPRSRELRSHLYASVLAQACNLGPVRMARISGMTYQKLV